MNGTLNLERRNSKESDTKMDEERPHTDYSGGRNNGPFQPNGYQQNGYPQNGYPQNQYNPYSNNNPFGALMNNGQMPYMPPQMYPPPYYNPQQQQQPPKGGGYVMDMLFNKASGNNNNNGW